MKRWAVGLLFVSAVCGCRQEVWKETHIPLPEHVTFATAQHALQQLDRQTPPVVQRDAEGLKVRYNSMHLSSRNLTVALEALTTTGQTERVK